MSYQPRNPDYQRRVAEIFDTAEFVQHLGIVLDDCGPGWVECSMALQPHHMQQDGVAHFGVQATLADHCAGAAAGTLAEADQSVLSVEFSLSLLRGARGQRLRSRATVIKPGATLTRCEAEVYAVDGDRSTLVSKAHVALATVRLG